MSEEKQEKKPDSICKLCKILKPHTDYYKKFRVCKTCTIKKITDKNKENLKGVEYVCEPCNYKSQYKTNYEAHIKSYKHLALEMGKNKQFEYACLTCNYKTNCIKDLIKHAVSPEHNK